MKKKLFILHLLFVFTFMGFSQTVLRIEAETFDEASGARAEDTNVGYIKNGTWIKFSAHVFDQYDTSFNVSASGETGGNVAFRLDAFDGTLIGTAVVNATSGWDDYQIVSTNITQTTGTHDLYLVFTGGDGYLFNLDYFEKVTNNPNAVTYTLTTNVSPLGSGMVSSSHNGTEFIEGTEITLTAQDNFGYNFVQWVDGSGNPVSTNNTMIFTLTSDTTLIAEFEVVNTYNLTVSADGAYGLGEYTIVPAGKDGGFTAYEAGTVVTITAIENDIVKFNNWSNGLTTLSMTVTMDQDISVAGNYDNETFIAGWTIKEDRYAHPRVAELYSSIDNRPELFAYNTADDVIASNVRTNNRAGQNGFSVWNSDRGLFFYYMTSFSTVGYENINILSGLLTYYYGCDEWTFQYSLDGENFEDVSSLTTLNGSSFTPIGGELPVEAEGQEKVYVRWFPNVDGPKHGDSMDVTATLLANISVMADEVYVEDTVAPVLLSILPVEGETSASASGNIIIAFNEKVKKGTGEAILNGNTLTPQFVNKTVKYRYYGLEYNTQYTFSLPAGAITDLSSNNAESIEVTFRTLEKPLAVKRGFDLIVYPDATNDQVASGMYVRTVADAFSAAPSNSATRFLVLITNGTYNLGGDGNSPESNVLTLNAGKDNVSLIAQSKDKVILQGNPAIGMKNAVLSIKANNLYMEHITVEHIDGMVNSGQKPALNAEGDRNVYNGIKLRSRQDTQLTGGDRSFYYKSTFEGDVDFIFGGGTHWFEACNINVVNGGYIVAPAHDDSVKYGYVFNKNTITAVTDYYLGRPWKNSPKAVYLNTIMINTPHAKGWADMGTVPGIFAEYNSVNANGVLVNTDNRTNVFSVSGVDVTGNYNPVLTSEEAAEYTIENVLGGSDNWNPLLIIEQIVAPINLTAGEDNTLTWRDNLYAICYVISRDGKFVAITTDTTFVDVNATSGTHQYTVQSANEYGGLSAEGNVSMTTEGDNVVSSISYFNAIDNVEITGLNTTEYTEGIAVTLSTPTLEGYTFFGWSTSATEPNSIKEVSNVTIGNQVFYAFWGQGGNNQPDEDVTPIDFDYSFTAATDNSWDNPANFDPTGLPQEGDNVSCKLQIETTGTLFEGNLVFSEGGNLRLRGNHASNGKLTFTEGTKMYYYTSGSGMSLNAPIDVVGNVRCELMSSIENETIMTLSGAISGSGNLIPVNVGQGEVINNGVLFLKGDNNDFNGTWDITQNSLNYPDLEYTTSIEGNSKNAFGAGTINVAQNNKVIFSHERAAGSHLKLNISDNAKAVLNAIVNVQELTINGTEFTEGTYSATTHPEFFEGFGEILVTTQYDGGSDGAVPAFPGAEGHGKYVTGGRGGKVIYVTNLNDNGPGSLREAINQSGPRIVVFKISGTIKLESELSISSDITIAGQTAPGGGITLRDYNAKVRGDNVIIRYIRFRMGDDTEVEEDALGGRFQENIIIDHCSMSWSTDECVSFYENKNFTLQWCVISESLRNSVHDKGAHGYGGIWGGLKASFHHNLLAHHDSRNPRLGEYGGRTVPLEGLLDLRNNVIYNWGGNSCYGGDAMNVNIVNNYYKPGPGTSSGSSERILSTGRNLDETSPLYGIWGQFFIEGNIVEGSTQATEDNWTYGVYNQFHSNQLPVSKSDEVDMKIEEAHDPGEITTHSASRAFDLVLEYAGASLYRDEVDLRAVNDTRSGGATIMDGGNGSTNGYIDTPSAVGGWPVLPTGDPVVDTDADGMSDAWEIEHNLDPQNPIDGNLKTVDGLYTNVEVYINSLVASTINSQNGSLEVYVTPENFIEKYGQAENGSKFIMAEGIYNVGEVAIKNHDYTFVPDGASKPVFSGYFFTENSAIKSAKFMFDGIDFDLTDGNLNFMQFKNGSGLLSLEIKNGSIKGIKQSLLLTDGESDYSISKVVIDNCIIDGTIAQEYSFIQPDERLVDAITVTNTTIFGYEKGKNFIWLKNKNVADQTIKLTIEGNTIYNACKPNGNGFVRIDNAYNDASRFKFINNIIKDERESEAQVLLFNATNNEGLGRLVLDNNLIIGVSSYSVTGNVIASVTNEVTLTGLGLDILFYPNPSIGEFSFSVSSPLATASSTGGILGDPRWLKDADIVISDVTYINSLDGEEMNGLSPNTYIEGINYVLPVPNFEGYTFFGWSSSSSIPGLMTEIFTNSISDKTYYAFWGEGGNNHSDLGIPINYTINYLNLPVQVINPNLNTVDVGITYEFVAASSAGYRFLGWYTDANFTHEITVLEANQIEAVTVYGRWKRLGEFYAFPTVSENIVTLNSSEINDTVTIISPLGIIIKQINTTHTQTRISLDDLEAGTYFIKSSKTGMITRIVIK